MAMDIGAELRNAREAKGLSIRALAERTRIQPRTLAAIELNNIAAIPPRPFGPGVRESVRGGGQPRPRAHRALLLLPVPGGTSLAGRAACRSVLDAEESTPPAVHRRGPPSLARRRRMPASRCRRNPKFCIAGRRNRPQSRRTLLARPGADRTGPDDYDPGAAPAVAPPPDAERRLREAASCAATARSPSRSRCPASAGSTRAPDGTRVLYRILEPGESHTLDAGQQAIAMRIGDAGAVAWTLNGRQGTTARQRGRGSRPANHPGQRGDAALSLPPVRVCPPGFRREHAKSGSEARTLTTGNYSIAISSNV